MVAYPDVATYTRSCVCVLITVGASNVALTVMVLALAECTELSTAPANVSLPPLGDGGTSLPPFGTGEVHLGAVALATEGPQPVGDGEDESDLWR